MVTVCGHSAEDRLGVPPRRPATVTVAERSALRLDGAKEGLASAAACVRVRGVCHRDRHGGRGTSCDDSDLDLDVF